MPNIAAPFGWPEVAVGFAILAIVAFLVTYVVTDLLKIGRAIYIAILAVVVGVLVAAYLAWSGMPVADLGPNAAWGVLAGVLAAAVVFPLVRKLPSRPHAEGARFAGLLAWDGVVYGTAEALLLATLPVLVIWQGVSPGGDGPRLAAGALAVLGSLVVVLVHHLGYAEFRRRETRTKLMGALVTCGIQALAFLLTGSIAAPVVAHILLHSQMIMRGVELPPARRREAPPIETTYKERVPAKV
jgi:hypothetical protein